MTNENSPPPSASVEGWVAGLRRYDTYIMPNHDDVDIDDNKNIHVELGLEEKGAVVKFCDLEAALTGLSLIPTSRLSALEELAKVQAELIAHYETEPSTEFEQLWLIWQKEKGVKRARIFALRDAMGGA